MSFSEINHRPFGYPQNKSTTAKYQGYILQVACFVLRYCSLGTPPIPVLFTERQEVCARDLQHAIDHPTQYSDEMWDNLIHSLLTSLFFHKHSAITHYADKDPIQMALMLLSLQEKNGNFDSCYLIVGKMSALLHTMRLVAVKEIRREADEDLDMEDGDYE